MHTHAHTRRKRARTRFAAPKRARTRLRLVGARIFTKKLVINLNCLMNISLKLHKDRIFLCGDICKTLLTFKNHQFSMYFAYFHSFAPSKSSKMDNYWITIKIFGNKISKCTFLMNKNTPVPAHRLLCSPGNKQIVFDSF